MFHRKSKADKARDAASARARTAGEAVATARDKATKNARDAAEVAARARGRAAAQLQHTSESIQQGTEVLLESFKEKVGPRAGAAAAATGAAALTARDRAVAGLDRGIDAAVPRVDHAVTGMGPKVDHARDVIVEDLLPKIHELLGGLQSTKDDALSTKKGPVAVVTGSPKKRRRKGGVLIALGLLAAIGAGVAWYLDQQQSRPERDPWAGTPDRPIGGAPGVDSQVRDTLATQTAATGAGATATASGTPAVTTTTGMPVPGAGTGTGPTDQTGTSGGASSGDVRLLDSEEIDELAADRPVEADEHDVPRTNTDATTGLGTGATKDDLGGTPRP